MTGIIPWRWQGLIGGTEA
ncbi:hypothetical protein [Glaciimonas sp. Cout2]